MKIILKEHYKPSYTILNLKKVLVELKMTQADLARILKISRPFVCDIVNGKRYIPEQMLLFLEKKLGTDADLIRDKRHT